MKKLAIALASFAFVVAVSASAQTMTFNTNLTVGSRGAEVSALQSFLISKGFLKISAPTAYFGPLTRAAVIAFQQANGITPAAGFFGPITRAKANGTSVVSTPSTPSGYTPVAGNTGVEGTLSMALTSQNVPTTIYEGDKKVVVYAARLEAKNSDINVQRVKLDLGNSTKIYNKIYDRLYVLDDSMNTVAEVDLNSSTVVKDGSNYYVTISNFSYVIGKNTKKNLYIAADVFSSIDSTDLSSDYTITIGTDGIRGVDGAAIDQFAPNSALSRSMNVDADQVDSSRLTLSTNSSTIKSTDVVATSGSLENEADKVTLFSFDLRAEKDSVDVTDLTIKIATTSGSATFSNVYLMDGSTVIESITPVFDAVNSYEANFTNIDSVVVAKDSTKTYTVAVDVRNAGTSATVFKGTLVAADVTAENSRGDSVATKTGSATGENMYVRNTGPVIVLNSRTISTSGSNNSGSTLSTSTIKASFSVQITAKGGDLTFGSQASTSASRAFAFKTYNNAGSEVTFFTASSSGFAIPSSGVVTTGVGSNSFRLQENNTMTISDLVFELPGKDAAGNPIAGTAIGIDAIRWSADDGATISTSNFMSGKTDWRTSVQNP
jgi:peptidoglycan hydrolase-like protein with peptidoglycan-binding domain